MAIETLNKDDIVRRDCCRLCNSKNLECVIKFNPTPLADEYIPKEHLDMEQSIYPLDLFLCKDCGFSQLLDVVQPQAIYFDYLYETKSSLGLVAHFGRYAKETVESVNLARGSFVVDIGSNDGSLLKFFKDNHGMKVLGIDPAREIAKNTTESGIETLPELFNMDLSDKIKDKYGKPQLVTANNIFANVDDMQGMTQGIRNMLSDDGVFIFESYYLGDLMKNMVFDFIYHEHISSFSVMPFDKFFRNNGMELLDVKRVPTKGGSLRYTVQLEGGSRKRSQSVDDMMALEKQMGINEPWSFKEFMKKVDKLREENVELLKEIKGEGKKIVGYGASATSTSLLYYFDIVEYLDCIIDDNPIRQGLYSPGAHIPIVSSDILYGGNKPDYVYILAWRYYEPIMDNHKKYFGQGGEYIIPAPEMKVIGGEA